MKSLLIVDMQKGFMTRPQYQNLISPINKLMKGYDKIILTKFINKKNSFYESKLNWTSLQEYDSQQIVVDIPNNSIIFDKYGYGLHQKDLEMLIDSNMKEIDICGVQTDACVYAIALQLFDNGIYPNVLINYTATTNEEKQNQAKNMLLHQFGKVEE